MNSPLQRLDAMLGAGESIAWTGRPAGGIRFRALDALLIPLSLVWSGFVFVWETLVIRSGTPLFPLFGIPFVLVGLYLLVGRFLVDAYQRSHTTYAVTNRAAYVVSDGFFASSRTYAPASLTPLELTTASNGSGSVHFGPRVALGALARNGWSVWQPDRAQFFAVSDVARVYALLRDLADGSS